MKENTVPLWEKYALTIDQASQYFGIGQKKLRSIISLYKGAKWYMSNGNHILIKRKLFEDFLNEIQVI